MRCSTCGSDNREGRKFCASCGSPLAAACPKCSASNLPNEQFCGECGAALSGRFARAGREPPPLGAGELHVVTETAAAAAVEGERKIVTALFADLKGSTELMENLDPEEGRAI